MSKATICPAAFKLVQHFDTDINSELFKSSYSLSKLHPDQFHLAFIVLPSSIFLKVFLHFLTYVALLNLQKQNRK